MNEDVNLLPTRLERTVIYECPWVNLYRDKIALANGQVIEQYHYLDFGPGTITAVVENDAGEILMTKIARYPTGTVSWELPAGGIDEGETSLEAARREVLEETGFETFGHRQIYSYHPLNGIANMTVYVVHCRAGEGSGKWDENEVQAVRWFKPETLLEMIRGQEIPDGYAVIGLLLHRLILG
jgi:ADP-ribose pyrophosphatase